MSRTVVLALVAGVVIATAVVAFVAPDGPASAPTPSARAEPTVPMWPLHGVLRDADSHERIEGASVTVFLADGVPSISDMPASWLLDEPLDRSTSDAAGKFDLPSVPASERSVIVRIVAPGRAPVSCLLVRGPSRLDVEDRPWEFSLRRGTTIRGRVTRADGGAVAGARVWALAPATDRRSSVAESATEKRLWPRQENTPGNRVDLLEQPTTTASETGEFALHVDGSVASFDLRAVLPGEAWLGELRGVAHDAKRSGDAPVVRLDPAPTLDVRVVDADGTPVKDAEVRVSLPPPDGIWRRLTDAAGRVRFAPIWPGPTPTVTAYGPYLGSADWSEPVTADWEVIARRVDVQLPGRPATGGHTVVGVVTDDGGPVAGRGNVRLDGRWVVRCVVGREGRFALEHVPPGRHEVTFDAEGMATATASIDVPGPEVQLRTRRVSGVWMTLVTPPETPPPDSIEIHACGESGDRSAQVFTSVEPTAWTGGRAAAAIGLDSSNGMRWPSLVVRIRGFAPEVRALPADGRELLDLGEIRFVRVPSVRGRVVDRAGRGVAAAWVQLRGSDAATGPSGGEAVTGPDGSFEIVGLDPGLSSPNIIVRARGYPDIDEELAADPVGAPPLVLTLRR